MIRRAWPLLALLLLVAPVASADDVAAARAAFEQGASLANEGRWNDALAQFERSASLRPHATTLYNIGFCERALGHPTRAKRNFVQALARDAAAGKTELTPELRAAISRYLVEENEHIAMPKLTIAPPDATVSVDGRPLERVDDDRMLAGTRAPGPGERVPRSTFVLEVDEGPHEIVVIAPDGRSKVVHEDFVAGTTKLLRLEIPPLPPPQEVVVDRGSTRRTAGLVVGGVGLVALGFGGWFGWHAHSLWNDAKAQCPALTTCPTDEGAHLSSSAKTYANLSTLAVAAGTTAVLGGVLLYVTAPGPTAVTVGVSPGGVTLGASF